MFSQIFDAVRHLDLLQLGPQQSGHQLSNPIVVSPLLNYLISKIRMSELNIPNSMAPEVGRNYSSLN